MTATCIPGGSRITDQRERLRPGQAARRYTELRIRTIQAKSGVAAMNRQVLQLHGAAFGHPDREQFAEQRPVAGSSVSRMKTLRTTSYTKGECTPCPRKKRARESLLCSYSDPPVKISNRVLHGRRFP